MKVRVIVASLLLPLLLVVLFVLPKICTVVLAGLMAAVAAYELLSGTGLVKQLRLNIYCMVMALFVCLWFGLGLGYGWLMLGILIFWSALFAEMMASGMKLPFSKLAICFAAGLLLPTLLGSVIRIHSWQQGRILVCVPFLFAFLSDSGAYFAGILLGKHKLAPTISPKKTVEGVIGGSVACVVGMLIYCAVLQIFFKLTPNYLFAVLYGLIGSAGAVFGDLCFSVIKRQTNIKDYGKLFPGHGGVLDRFDSMMVVGPLAEVLLLLLPLVV